MNKRIVTFTMSLRQSQFEVDRLEVEAKKLVSYVVEEVIENNEVVTEELTETVETPVAEETATETPEKEDAE